MTPGDAAQPSAARSRSRAPALLLEQLADHVLLLGIVALAEVDVAHAPLAIQEVGRRPVLVLVRLPDRVVVVLDDRILKVVLGDRVAHVRLVALERELGRVHPDDHEPGLAVAAVPRLQVRERADAVDARVGPEVHEHGVPAQVVERERSPARRVEPRLRPREVGSVAEHRQRRPRGVWPCPPVRLAVPAQVRKARLRRAALLELLRRVHEEGGQVVGDGGLEAQVVLAQHEQGHQHHHRARGELEAGALPGDPASEPPAADHQHVQHHRRADAIRERHGEPSRRERLRRGHRDHPGEDRPGARRVHEPEAQPEHETRSEALARTGRVSRSRRHEPADRGLEPGA